MSRKRRNNPNVLRIEDYAKRANTDVLSSAGSVFGYWGRPLSVLIQPYNPDTLVARKGLKTYRTMMSDEQIKAALLVKKYAVLSTGYEIQTPDVPEEDQSQELSDEITRFVEFNFNEMVGSIEAKIYDVMSAVEYGFSCSEKVLWSIDYGEFEGHWGLKDLKTRPPEDITFEMDGKGDVTPNGVQQFGQGMPRDRFVVYSYRGQFGNPYGESDLRAAYRAYWLKDSLMKMMSISLERYAEPIATATYKGVLTPEQERDLLAFMQNLQTRSGILLPESVILDFKSPPPRAAEAYIPAINLLDQQLRIAILMPGLIGLSGEAQVGSLARAVKEFDVFLWILGQLRKDLERIINEQIIKPLVDLNYEVEHSQYPEFHFREVTEEARQRQFELFLMGLGAGALNKGPEDENKLRDLIGFEPLPEDFVPPDPMAALLGGTGPLGLPAPNGNGNGGPQFGQPPNKTDAGKSEKEKPTDKQPKPKAFSADQEVELIEFVHDMKEDYNIIMSDKREE